MQKPHSKKLFIANTVFFLRKTLHSIKNLPEAGAVSAEAHARARAHLLRALPDAVFEEAPSKTVYVAGFMQSLIYKPVAASAAAVVFLAGGWMTTNAAQSSLPGDTLYNVKRITERAQLQLASLDRRAVLHTEFAGRRLEEVAALQRASKNEPARASYISQTVNAYQQEIASATTDLQTLQTQNQTQALAIATNVLEQVVVLTANADEIVSTASTQSANGGAALPDESIPSQDVEQVKETTDEIQNVATDVALNAHEAAPSDESRRTMESLFRSLLGSIEARRAMVLHRIDKLEELSLVHKDMLAQEGIILPSKATFRDIETTVKEMDEPLPTIMDNFAAGGYRSAIKTLQEMDGTLSDIEKMLTEVEEEITNAFMNMQNETNNDVEQKEDPQQTDESQQNTQE